MKVSEAHPILKDLLGDGPYWPEEKRREAVKLGIEALKLLEHQRTYLSRAQNTILPGETPDDK